MLGAELAQGPGQDEVQDKMAVAGSLIPPCMDQLLSLSRDSRVCPMAPLLASV